MSDGIRPGARVTLHYRLACAGEDIVDTFADDEPETFSLGRGEMDGRLEILLLDLRPGDHRSWQLDAREAFGLHDPALVHALPRADFPPQSELCEGLQMAFDLPNGQSMHGILRAIGDETVTVDFNHPLAGLPVEFEVKILAVE
ncbi:MAG: FKBP-type peptidyl-prolyl cis-trans isomerase [Betaproteobacteria bacterium]|nr:FKBP-type peptidyl-prolyl cis-trans isomerase [Betaproteobacteria bacterium]